MLRPTALTPLSTCLAFLLLLATTILVQLRDGAHSLDFTDDDAAHYVTGLLFHDYLLSGFRVGPLPTAAHRPDRSGPSLFAVRGSRLLGGGGYNNRDYLPRFATPAEVALEIDRYAI